jgi:DNA modification methylase
MFTKILKKSEISHGFIQIPSGKRSELFGNREPPFSVKLNDSPARVDQKGRLWSEYLKNRYSVETEVIVINNADSFQVTINGHANEAASPEIIQPFKPKSDYVKNSRDNKVLHKVLEGDCIKYLREGAVGNVHLTFFDPPYLQGKDYRFFDDKMSEEKYWTWTKEILSQVYNATFEGGAIYFMQREKNAEKVLQTLRETGWEFQNLIIWKKKTSAVPINTRFSKQYQIIAYAIKGDKPRVFNKLRIDPPPLPEHKWKHENGVYLTDVWDDIRELTSGYFAGDEALRDAEGKRMHVQQTPVALLLRIILSSTMQGDIVFDPNAGTGTALVVAKQLARNSIGIEIDPVNVEIINSRLNKLRAADDISDNYDYYGYSPNLKQIWQTEKNTAQQKKLV